MFVELKIDDLRRICVPENYEITIHAAKRLEQRNTSINDVISCIQEGEIIEQYPDDYKLPYTWSFCEAEIYPCCNWKQSGDALGNNSVLS